MKRVFDFSIAFFGLIVLFPFLFGISMVILISREGPVLYKQTRMGRNRKEFVLYKFRSMSFVGSSIEGRFEPGNTSRVTRIGKILRKTKLDELPQLLNVLLGDMSVVGPRPEVRKWTEVYLERWEKILTIRPGITDNASIEFRNEERMLSESQDPEKVYLEMILPRKLDLNEDYIKNHSLCGDIRLIIRTILCVLKL